MVRFFDDQINVRIREDEYEAIEDVIKEKQDLYSNVSHFIRVAIIKLLNEERKK